MDTRLFRSIVMAILAMTLVGMPFLGSPTPTSAASPSKNVVADSTTPPPVINAPDSVPEETKIGANIMRAANWRGDLLAEFRLWNHTPYPRTIGIRIGANGHESFKSASAPANTETEKITWPYFSAFNLTRGIEYNMWYTITVSGLPPVYGQRNLTTSELPQIGMDVSTRECCVSALAGLNFRPRDDPSITVTVAGAVIWASHLAQDVWSGWISVTSSATGGPVAVQIDASEPGRASSRDVIFVETCPPPPCILLGDRVWLDADANGQQNVGEPGMAGITVTISGSGNSVVTRTNESGVYNSGCLNPGEHSVQFTLPPGYLFTTPNQGPDETDSDPIGGVAVVNLVADNMTIDAGVIPVDTASVICFCIELRNGLNVVRWTLGDTANGDYAILRAPSPNLAGAVWLRDPIWDLGLRSGVYEWPDPQGTATSWYWLAERVGGRIRMYGPIQASATICQSFLPMVRR